MKVLGGIAAPHEKTTVLMISWCKEKNDLETSDEVNQLASVFRDLFNYKVVQKEITPRRKPQIQVQKMLADFVDEYDDRATLLIVYYAGHGIPNEPGNLLLAG